MDIRFHRFYRNYVDSIIVINSLLLDSNPTGIIGYLTLLGFVLILGVAISDTAMDGFILDICPKEKLGRTTGTVWAFRSLGIIIGGPIILTLIF